LGGQHKRIICGIDPGLRATGYGVLEVDTFEDTLKVLDAGVLRCSPHDALAQRLAELAASVEEVFDEHRVHVVAVEQIYTHMKRPRTAVLMAHARGVILCEAARRNLRVINLPSTSVKRHLTGNGRASKEQMQRAVATTLNLKVIPKPADVADALAIALCAIGVLEKPARAGIGNDDLMVQ
jgi:crossover junction endodeoxyribonuclease RuvC